MVKKEIILVNGHLPADPMVSSQPHICLFCSGQIEEPTFAISADELGIGSGIAVLLAESVCCFVLGLEMEDVDGEANVGKEWVVLDMLGKRTVVVKENMFRFEHFDTKCMLEEFLKRDCE